MKQSIAGLELHYLVKELQFLKDAKIQQIYMADSKEMYLQCHVTSIGKKTLKMQVPSLTYLTANKPAIEAPPSFCLYLRRRLSSARIRHIKQLGLERVIEIKLETKDETYYLITEFFAKGNIILCDKDHIILSQSERQNISGRKIQPKETYPVPEREFQLLKLTESTLQELTKKTESPSLVKMLATDLGLGGVYAEEVCILSGVDKNTEPSKLKQHKEVVKALKSLLNKKPSPVAVYKKDQLKDIVPFKLNYYKDLEQKAYETYHQAFDDIITQTISEETPKKLTKSEKELQKLQSIIQHQSDSVNKLKKKEKDNQDKAAAIYENYQLVQDTITQIKEASKKLSWKEIKAKLKNHKIIKSVNAKDKTVTMEL